jgi:hypothetical protein
MKFFLIQKHRKQFARATRSTMREAVGEFKWSALRHPTIPTATYVIHPLPDRSEAKWRDLPVGGR